MAMIISNAILSSRQTVSATNEAVSEVSSFYLEAMADRRAKTITNLINSNFDHMEKAVSYINSEKIGSEEELRATLGNIKALLSPDDFEELCVMLKNLVEADMQNKPTSSFPAEVTDWYYNRHDYYYHEPNSY